MPNRPPSHLSQTLAPFVQARDDQTLVDAFITLIELADSCPRLFKPILPNLLSVSVSIAKDKDFDDRTRQTALEMMLTIAESAPALARKTPNFAAELVPVAMEMVTDIEDEESWYTTEDVSNIDSGKEKGDQN